ncbi:MAG TPA: bifunctional oligoribonuclease/PAP phosphatase NrnA [Firmicutes bacterium]|nr:bifunctional oligoribonuclease/PAP phosphatase NrnA [Bacillota bacterium]
MNTLGEVAEFLAQNDNYIICGHENPDPDSLGSMLGLYFGLSKIGKTCRMVSGDPIPANLSWPGLELIERVSDGTLFDPGEACVIVLDCEPHRTGAIAPGVKKAGCLINIDHHERGRGQGSVVYVDPKEAATSIIVYRILHSLGVDFNLNIATALYGGIVGDTGGFRHANTTGEVLQIAAELLGYGVKPAPLAREIFSSLPFSFLQLLGFTLTNLKLAAKGRLVWAALSYADFKKFGADPQASDQLINYARMVDSAEITMVLRETAPGKIRLSLRANEVDVGRLARHFGGGGHKLAAGAAFAGDLAEIAPQVVEQAEEYLLTGEINERNC